MPTASARPQALPAAAPAPATYQPKPVPAQTAARATGAGQFTTAGAQARCPSDKVVWSTPSPTSITTPARAVYGTIRSRALYKRSRRQRRGRPEPPDASVSRSSSRKLVGPKGDGHVLAQVGERDLNPVSSVARKREADAAVVRLASFSRRPLRCRQSRMGLATGCLPQSGILPAQAAEAGRDPHVLIVAFRHIW